MSKGRLEAFSDGVIAIILTIMVLELKVPHGTEPSGLLPLWPSFFSYLLSFVMLGVYWNNHHHLLHAVKHVDGRVLWANLHLLFWLSLIPVTTAWLGEHLFEPWPVALYGIVLFLAAVAYYILVRVLISAQGGDSFLAEAIGGDAKGKWSLAIYTVAVLLAFVAPWISNLLYVTVTIIWLVPDKRIERHFGK